VSRKKKWLNDYARYAGIGFQLAGILLLFVFLGIKADSYLGTHKPYFTLLGGLVGAFAGIYLMIKQIKS